MRSLSGNITDQKYSYLKTDKLKLTSKRQFENCIPGWRRQNGFGWRNVYRIVPAFILLYAGTTALAQNWPGAEPLPAPTVTASVDFSQQGQPIPQHFLGFSMESPVVESYVGDGQHADSVLVNLINNFDVYNGSPSLRPAAPTPYSADSQLNSTYLSDLKKLEDATHSPLIVTIGLGRDYPQYAANVAEAVTSSIGNRHGLYFELGNEPDQLVHQGHRPKTYSFSDYLDEYNGYLNAILPFTNGKQAAGMTSGTTSWDTANQAAFLQAESPTLGLYTSHEYPLSACDGLKSITIAHLLSDNIATAFYRRYAPLVAAAQPYEIPVRADEVNSVSCSGVAGVSNTFASSLWVLDSLFEMAHAGVVGMNLHTGSPATGGGNVDLPYNAFYIDGTTVQVRPIYYGMLMFARAIQEHAALVPVTATLTGTQNVKIWATLDTHHRLRIVVIEKDINDGSQTISLHLGEKFFPIAKLSRLVTHSPQATAATDQVYLSGQTFDGTKDGRLHGFPKTSLVFERNGDFVFNVPNGSAAMLTVQMRRELF